MSLINEHPSHPETHDEENFYTHNRIPTYLGLLLLIISLCVNAFLYQDSTSKTKIIDSLRSEAYDTQKEIGELQQKVDTYYSKQKTAGSYLDGLGYSSEEIDIITNSIASPFLAKRAINDKIANGESLTKQEQSILKLLQ